jgi:hypothetical protein
VTSELPVLFSHRSSAFLRVIRLIDFVTQLTAVLHAGSLASTHNFLSLCLCYINRSKAWSSLFMFESVTLLVGHLYAETIEAVEWRAALSASTPDLILSWGDINSEARLWNRSQSVNFSTGSENFLILTWSGTWNTVGTWQEVQLLVLFIFPHTDRIENVFPIIACSLDVVTCPQSCYSATAVLLSPVYTAVIWQWIYMLQYFSFWHQNLCT